ncbi:hypothetical protein AAW51_5300 [Caldimonas brevitalea]|uniref:Asl1-like glycosyl hydrolase catalytic domain-containing protein n=1 Tax=Caldimonas brevitalea TaxID=413882 RepID=A0A0G3BX94_9BURK|nr:hypothetical protein AAW51_5300 [Caldimonas brevitalea]
MSVAAVSEAAQAAESYEPSAALEAIESPESDDSADLSAYESREAADQPAVFSSEDPESFGRASAFAVRPELALPEVAATTEMLTAASATVALPESGGRAVKTTVLASSSMETTFAATAPGWKINYWGVGAPSWKLQRETRSQYVFRGGASQLFVVGHDTAKTHLTYPYAFGKGKTYRSTLYVRSHQPAQVTVQMRREAPPWDAFGTKTIQVNSTWQKVEITGTYPADVAGTLRVSTTTPDALLWIDEVKIEQLEHNELAPFSTAPIPDTLFGMHINKLGRHQNYPQLGHHVVRLWNTGTTWRDLEPSRGVWTWTAGHGGKRLDMYVDYVKRNDPKASILYTLGQTPTWASRTPGEKGLYGYGASGVPTNFDDWRNYVRTLARRYAGKIQYWELWNEPDFQPHFNGSIQDMVKLARIAHEELKAADPANKLVSPGVTSGQGMNFLNNFLAAGGGQHVDVIGYHWYFNASPEGLVPLISNVRHLMKAYGVDNKPLWNTEGAPGCDALTTTCSSFVPSQKQIRSTTARALMMMWAKGVSNFNYHIWESSEPLAKLVESDFKTQTEAGNAYAAMVRWMRGARMTDAYVMNKQIYVFKLTRGTDSRYVLWSTVEGQRVQLPGWKVTRAETLQGKVSILPNPRQITLGLEPVMLRM